ncbi:hypothetical protein [Litoreibacter janthinus]|nr:hypothetical protein [Litoreibacter janthinus]
MMATDPDKRARATRRFERQFDAMERMIPALRRPLTAIRARGWWIVRVPVAIIFILGSFLAVLPVFGVWMLPIGLLLLAVDLEVLRGPISDLIVRARRRLATWRRRG